MQDALSYARSSRHAKDGVVKRYRLFQAIMITNEYEETKMDQLITMSKLFTLEQQEWYLRNFRIGTETRSYIFKCFELNMIKIFGEDEMARYIIEELR